jgi:hypothetical protein
MEMKRFVEMMVVEEVVDLAPVDKNVAEEHALVPPTVSTVSAVMMVVVETLVVHVPTDKVVPMESVLEPELEPAKEEVADTTEWEEAVVLAKLDKDAEQEFVNVTTTVTTAIVETHLKNLALSAHLKAVVPAPVDLSAALMDCALLWHLAMLLLLLKMPSLETLLEELVPLISVEFP